MTLAFNPSYQHYILLPKHHSTGTCSCIHSNSAGDLTDLKKKTIIIKEGIKYRLRIQYHIQRDIVTGLKYVQHSYRKGIKGTFNLFFFIHLFNRNSHTDIYLLSICERCEFIFIPWPLHIASVNCLTYFTNAILVRRCQGWGTSSVQIKHAADKDFSKRSNGGLLKQDYCRYNRKNIVYFL